MLNLQLEPGFIRDLLHNLDPNNSVHMELYKQARYRFISENKSSTHKKGFDLNMSILGHAIQDLKKSIDDRLGI